MAATQNASTSLDLYNVWSDILNTYLGQACTHIKVTKVLDPNGNVIDESQTETTIYAAISPVSKDVVLESAGVLQYGDLTFYALNDAGVIVGTQTSATGVRYDMIEYKSVMYTVVQQSKTAYDDGVAVVSRYVLRKVAYE
jgi:hypothetical protein